MRTWVWWTLALGAGGLLWTSVCCLFCGGVRGHAMCQLDWPGRRAATPALLPGSPGPGLALLLALMVKNLPGPGPREDPRDPFRGRWSGDMRGFPGCWLCRESHPHGFFQNVSLPGGHALQSSCQGRENVIRSISAPITALLLQAAGLGWASR